MDARAASSETLPAVVVIFRGIGAEDVCAAVPHLLDAGLSAFEVTLNSPDCFRTIKELSRLRSDTARIGAGTVLSPEQVRQSVEAGATYIISPNINPAVVAESKALGALSIPGTTTATEVQAAVEAGADLVKLFPAASLGIDYLRQLRATLDHVPLLPSGGVDAAFARASFAEGCPAVGVGAHLFGPEAFAARDWSGLARGAADYLATAGLR